VATNGEKLTVAREAKTNSFNPRSNRFNKEVQDSFCKECYVLDGSVLNGKQIIKRAKEVKAQMRDCKADFGRKVYIPKIEID
jgi:urate oxidase